MAIWNALQYGWNVNYWLTIAGVNCVLTEAPVQQALPGDFTVGSAALSIDRSAEVGQAVDRSTGMGQGLPLTFSLLTNAITNGLMRAPVVQTTLTMMLARTETTTMHVADASGFTVGKPVHIGQECILFSGKTSNTLTGLTRGCYGSQASTHFYNTIGATVTDYPGIWRGREARLYAAPIAPDGSTTGATLADESVEVWRGHVDQGPYRDGGDKFTIEAIALDRILANPLPAGSTGKVLPLTQGAIVDPSDFFWFFIEAWDASDVPVGFPYSLDVKVYPYAANSGPTALTTDDQAAAIQGAVAAELTALSATGEFKVVFNDISSTTGAAGMLYEMRLVYKANPGVSRLRLSLLGSGNGSSTPVVSEWGNFAGGYVGALNPPQILVVGGFGFSANLMHFVNSGSNLKESYVLRIELDNPSDAIPYPGIVTVGDEPVLYQSATLIGNMVELGGLSKPATPGAPWLPSDDPNGKTATLQFSKSGSATDLMLRLLQSSGLNLGAGANDLWQFGQGYGLPDSMIDASDIVAKLGPITAGLNLRIGGTALSLQDMFGGLLVLTQLGIVARPSADGSIRLGLVRTDVGGSLAKVTIGDEHLLGLSAEPIAAIRKRDPVTQIAVSTQSFAKNSDQPISSLKYVLQETAGVLEVGGQSLDLTLGVDGPTADVIKAIQGWAVSILRQSHLVQTMEFRVVPWIQIETGDLVAIDVTHPAIWDWNAGREGYTGMARCIGARRDLAGGALILTLLIQGGPMTAGLSPSAPVLAWDSAMTPTWIEVGIEFLPFLQQMLASGASRLVHYQRGLLAETGGGNVLVSAAAPSPTSSNCRLAISSSAAFVGPLSVASSCLTLPVSGTATTFQKSFAHADDGTFWG